MSEAAHPARPKVVYLMGAGRSGSTILGVALGNCDGFFFAGELDRWLARAGVPRDGSAREGFWGAVRARVAYPPELAGRTTWMERSSSLLDPRRWRARRRLRGPYLRASGDLYRAVACVSEATHVVDSSHYPMRARELQALDEIDLYLVYLVRDPQAVVASLGRSDVRERHLGTMRANAYLWLTALLSVLVFVRHPADRRMLVRFEDFLAAPAIVIAEILRRCGASAQPPDVTHLRTGVPFHGNRLIEGDVVKVAVTPPQAHPRSPATALLQRPWRAVLARLRPAVSAGERRPATPAG